MLPYAMSDLDFSANVERFTGFGKQYDRVRPSPPAALADLLLGMARCTQPALVVDLGSGTGLSTRYWSPYAQTVLGIEPTDAMREQAEKIGGDPVAYRKGFSHATGLPDRCADLVICGQALHWMEPASTFAESARILRDGGVFAAYDYDWPPATSFWEVDRAYTQCMTRVRRLEREHGITESLKQWDKSGHLTRMEESGSFRYVRECLLHHEEEGDAERIVGVLLSQGSVQSLFKLGVSEDDLLIPRLRDAAERTFGFSSSRWFWSARIRVGIR
jgi:SAM-dependent methyltransferase